VDERSGPGLVDDTFYSAPEPLWCSSAFEGHDVGNLVISGREYSKDCRLVADPRLTH